MRLFEALGGWVATVPELDVKMRLGTHCYHHAWHAELWHKRLPELREMNPERLTVPANDELVAFVDAMTEPEAPEQTIEKLVGVYRVLIPHKIAAYTYHLNNTSTITDAPTIRSLKFILQDEFEDWRDGEMLIQSLIEHAGGGASGPPTHQAQLEKLMLAAGGIAGPARSATPTSTPTDERQRRDLVKKTHAGRRAGPRRAVRPRSRSRTALNDPRQADEREEGNGRRGPQKLDARPHPSAPDAARSLMHGIFVGEIQALEGAGRTCWDFDTGTGRRRGAVRAQARHGPPVLGRGPPRRDLREARRLDGHRDRRVRRVDVPLRGGVQPRPGPAPHRREPGARGPGHRRVQHDAGVRRRSPATRCSSSARTGCSPTRSPT